MEWNFLIEGAHMNSEVFQSASQIHSRVFGFLNHLLFFTMSVL